MQRLDVETGKMQFVLLGVLAIIFVPAGVAFLSDAVQKRTAVPLIVGVTSLGVFGLVFGIVFRAYRRTVRYFTSEGLVRNDGKFCGWSGLNRVVEQYRLNRVGNLKLYWRTEIHFADGSSAWIIPVKTKNYTKIREFVHRLPCERDEVRV